MNLLVTACFALALAAAATAQENLGQTNVDPAWARLNDAAQYVLAAQSGLWNAIEVRDSSPTVVSLVDGVANLTVACTGNSNIWLVAVSADDFAANIEFVQIPRSFFNEGTEIECSPDDCLPQIETRIYNSFIANEDAIRKAINDCSGDQPQLVTTTGSLTGSGGIAAMASLWVSQTYSGATTGLITFGSSWANILVDQTFVRVMNKQVAFNNNAPRPYSWYTGTIEILSANSRFVTNSCPGNILCKVTDYVDLACDLYNPTALLGDIPSAIVLASGTDRAAIMWFEAAGTAVFAFADLANLYTTWVTPELQSFQSTTPFFSQEFINIDAAIWQPTFSDIDNILGGEPTVFSQFSDPWLNLQTARSSQYQCQGLYECFQRLAGRPHPVNVVCTGHALGGAYATICGSWAGVAFPSSTVQLVTAGAPATIGNNFFYELQNLVVGSGYQVVNGQDPIPRYPACLSGTQLSLPGGLYINDTTLIMQRLDPLANIFSSCQTADIQLKDQECSLYAAALRTVQNINVNMSTPPQGTQSSFRFANLV